MVALQLQRLYHSREMPFFVQDTGLEGPTGPL